MPQMGTLILESYGISPNLSTVTAQNSWSKLYRTGSGLLDISYISEIGGAELRGQLLKEDGSTLKIAGHVSLIDQKNQIIAVTKLSETGQFELSLEAKGEFVIMVEYLGNSLRIPALVLS